MYRVICPKCGAQATGDGCPECDIREREDEAAAHRPTIEFETAVVRETEFVSIEVAVEFDANGEADVHARRVDNGQRVELRHEEAEHFAVAAARGDF